MAIPSSLLAKASGSINRATDKLIIDDGILTETVTVNDIDYALSHRTVGKVLTLSGLVAAIDANVVNAPDANGEYQYDAIVIKDVAVASPAIALQLGQAFGNEPKKRQELVIILVTTTAASKAGLSVGNLTGISGLVLNTTGVPIPLVAPALGQPPIVHRVSVFPEANLAVVS